MYRILLACEDEQMTVGISNALGEEFTVESCGTAQWAIDVFSSFMPEVVLITNRLPDMGPIDLARILRSTGRNFELILLSTVNSPEIAQRVESAGINSMFMKPCRPEHIAAHIQTMAFQSNDLSGVCWNVEDEVSILLADLGFRTGPERYRHVRQVILTKYYGDEDMMMKNIYLEVAGKSRGTSVQIEKAVRDGIKAARLSGDSCVWNLLFGSQRPTNEEFVTRIVDSLKHRQRFKKPLRQKIG